MYTQQHADEEEVAATLGRSSKDDLLDVIDHCESIFAREVSERTLSWHKTLYAEARRRLDAIMEAEPKS